MVDEAATFAPSSLLDARVDFWDIEDDKVVAVKDVGDDTWTSRADNTLTSRSVGRFAEKAEESGLLFKAIAGALSNKL